MTTELLIPNYYVDALTVVLIDDDDLDAVRSRLWHVSDHGYATSKGGSMHRLIMNAPIGMVVDHINGNRLDNRKANLRVVTSSQNNQNNKGMLRYGFKGVRLKNGRFVASISIPRGRDNGKTSTKHLGYFDDAETAARAYDAAVLVYIGPMGYRNFPESPAEVSRAK